MNAPRLSVIVNNYNYVGYVAQAIESALPQLLPGDELIGAGDFGDAEAT